MKQRFPKTRKLSQMQHFLSCLCNIFNTFIAWIICKWVFLIANHISRRVPCPFLAPSYWLLFKYSLVQPVIPIIETILIAFAHIVSWDIFKAKCSYSATFIIKIKVMILFHLINLMFTILTFSCITFYLSLRLGPPSCSGVYKLRFITSFSLTVHMSDAGKSRRERHETPQGTCSSIWWGCSDGGQVICHLCSSSNILLQHGHDSACFIQLGDDNRVCSCANPWSHMKALFRHEIRNINDFINLLKIWHSVIQTLFISTLIFFTASLRHACESEAKNNCEPTMFPISMRWGIG